MVEGCGLSLWGVSCPRIDRRDSEYMDSRYGVAHFKWANCMLCELHLNNAVTSPPPKKPKQTNKKTEFCPQEELLRGWYAELFSMA